MTEAEFREKIVKIQQKRDYLSELKQSDLPVIMWGTGSLSYNARRLLEKNGIRITCYWVDGEHEKELDGIAIRDIQEIAAIYPLINVVFGHSRYEKREEIVRKYPFIKEAYCLPNICYGKWEGITEAFVDRHIADWRQAYHLMEDQLSKESVIAFLNCKLTDDISYLLPCCEGNISYFINPFFKLGAEENYVDAGAYTGDTVKEFLGAVNSKYNTICAIEPEENSFAILKKFVEEEGLEDVSLHQCGCWNEKGKIYFTEDAESSGIDRQAAGRAVNQPDGYSERQSIEVNPLDDIIDGIPLSGKPVTLVKINYCVGLEETLLGAAAILSKQEPNLIITVGFDEWALIKVPKLLKSINPNYQLHIRFLSAMPARLVLYAYSKNKKTAKHDGGDQ